MNGYAYRQQLDSPYKTSSRHGSRKKRPLLLILAFLIVVAILIDALLYIFRDPPPVAPLPEPEVEAAKTEISDSTLLTAVSDVVSGAQGDYAVVVKSLDGVGESVYLNEDQEFQTASLYKLWIMATVFQQIEEGNLSLNTELEGKIEELNTDFDIASESAEFDEGEVSGTVEELLEDMITISDNYKALLLAKTVRMSNVAALLKEYGFKYSKTGSPPRTTASDIAEFYTKLYRGEIVSSDASQLMIDILLRQRLNDRIPEPLPENTKVAHKTGELGGYKHDAGIVYGPSGDYVIVILSETESQDEAVEVEQEISRVVWEYFENGEEQ